MQLIKKLFGRLSGASPSAGPLTSQFHESEPTSDDEVASRNAPRRELVQVMLRDCMRRHGIPSDWIECRILSIDARNGRTGMHVHLVVKNGVDRLLTYVPAFQGSFTDEITRFDPRVKDWLLSVSWQFENFNGVSTAMPDPVVWSGKTLPASLAPTPTARPAPAPVPVAATPQPTRAPATAAQKVMAAATPASPAAPVRPGAGTNTPAEDAEVMEDLQALFAIRDAAIGERPGGQPDFEPTRPGGDESLEKPDPAPPRRW